MMAELCGRNIVEFTSGKTNTPSSTKLCLMS